MILILRNYGKPSSPTQRLLESYYVLYVLQGETRLLGLGQICSVCYVKLFLRCVPEASEMRASRRKGFP